LSVHASPDHRPTDLDSVLDHAGGVRTLRGDCPVVAHYGSAAGELAACVSAVGLADCSDLTKLLLHGPAAHLRQLSSRLAGTELAPGGAVHSGGVWWCAETAERLIVLCDPRLGARLLAVVGRRARDLLADLGVYGATGDPRRVPPLNAHTMTGADVLWLLESDRKALALVPKPHAASVWRTIDRAGQRHGICAVGEEALTRYALIRRAADLL
jgi:glycine cleavage system aminomethyltransferase T